MADSDGELDKQISFLFNKKADLKNKSETTIYCKGPREDLLNFHLQSLLYIYNKCNNIIINKLTNNENQEININNNRLEKDKDKPPICQKIDRNSI